MATEAKGQTGKAGTSTPSTSSNPETSSNLLRPHVPQLRTAAAIAEKYEQIQDALEHDRMKPKVAEQMNQTLKGIVGLEKLAMQFLSLALKFGKKAPVPRSPILRDMLGLPVAVSSTDGETIRRMLPEG